MPFTRPRAGARAQGLLGLAAVVLLAACVAAGPGAGPMTPAASGTSGPTDPSTGSGALVTGAGADPSAPELAAAADTSRVRAAIAAADLSDPATIDAVNAVRFLDGAETAGAAAIAAGATGDPLWAATWVYATAGTDPKPLRPLLTNDDPSIRALAAAAILSWGDRSGAKPLVDLLLEEDALSGSDPPAAVADYAAGSLARYVVGPTIAADATREEVASAWQAWLDAHGAAMRFSATTGVWTAP